MEKISVIIPAYNAGDTIERCILSIIGGVYQNIEVIVINDGSTDATEAIVRKLIAKDPRIKLITQENSGVASARNTGLKNAIGEYIAWCDSDDWVESDWLSKGYHYLTTFQADISICSCQLGNSSEAEIEYTVWKKETAIELFLKHRAVTGVLWDKLFRRELFAGISFDPNLGYSEDADVVWKILKKANKIVRYYSVEYHYTVGGEGLTSLKYTSSRATAISVWNRVHHDCQREFPHFQKLSGILLGRQAFSIVRLMFVSDFYDDRITELQKYMREQYRFTIRHLGSFTQKIYYTLIVLNPKLARLVYKIQRR